MFEYGADRLFPGHLGSPGLRPGGGIFDRESIEERVFSRAGEAFDQAHLFARTLKAGFLCEVRRFDDERIAFPVATGTSRKLTHIRRKRRTLVQRDDASFVKHLDEDQDISVELHDL